MGVFQQLLKPYEEVKDEQEKLLGRPAAPPSPAPAPNIMSQLMGQETQERTPAAAPSAAQTLGISPKTSIDALRQAFQRDAQTTEQERQNIRAQMSTPTEAETAFFRQNIEKQNASLQKIDATIEQYQQQLTRPIQDDVKERMRAVFGEGKKGTAKQLLFGFLAGMNGIDPARGFRQDVENERKDKAGILQSLIQNRAQLQRDVTQGFGFVQQLEKAEMSANNQRLRALLSDTAFNARNNIQAFNIQSQALARQKGIDFLQGRIEYLQQQMDLGARYDMSNPNAEQRFIQDSAIAALGEQGISAGTAQERAKLTPSQLNDFNKAKLEAAAVWSAATTRRTSGAGGSVRPQVRLQNIIDSVNADGTENWKTVAVTIQGGQVAGIEDLPGLNTTKISTEQRGLISASHGRMQDSAAIANNVWEAAKEARTTGFTQNFNPAADNDLYQLLLRSEIIGPRGDYADLGGFLAAYDTALKRAQILNKLGGAALTATELAVYGAALPRMGQGLGRNYALATLNFMGNAKKNLELLSTASKNDPLVQDFNNPEVQKYWAAATHTFFRTATNRLERVANGENVPPPPMNEKALMSFVKAWIEAQKKAGTLEKSQQSFENLAKPGR